MKCSKCKADLSIGLIWQVDKGKYRRKPLCHSCYNVEGGNPSQSAASNARISKRGGEIVVE